MSKSEKEEGLQKIYYKMQKRASGFLCGRNYNMYQRRKVLWEYEMHVTC